MLMLTKSELESIRNRVNATTGIRWDDFEDNCEGVVYEYDRLTETNLSVVAECKSKNKLSDAEFIASAREDVPKLLNEVDRLQYGNEKLVEDFANKFKRDVGIMDTLNMICDIEKMYKKGELDYEEALSAVFSHVENIKLDLLE